MISLAIWCNKHLEYFQRLQIALVLRVRANFLSLKNLFMLINIKKHEIMLLPVQIDGGTVSTKLNISTHSCFKLGNLCNFYRLEL